MGLGVVRYKLPGGKDHEETWAATYSIVEDGAELKFKKVQIIVNPAHENEK
jgi:hypothetical protein